MGLSAPAPGVQPVKERLWREDCAVEEIGRQDSWKRTFGSI